ncbi:hypothetical protein [Streptomyces sp. NPDC058613]|uniref:hypothetical protein n=1 Tax=Streptomyces sp. NPDC058613 TaxID=3346556 RepID=UPI003668E2CA
MFDFPVKRATPAPPRPSRDRLRRGSEPAPPQGADLRVRPGRAAPEDGWRGGTPTIGVPTGPRGDLTAIRSGAVTLSFRSDVIDTRDFGGAPEEVVKAQWDKFAKASAAGH